MCIFAEPAKVSSTRIGIFAKDNRRFTAYQMTAEWRTSHGNAMILPVPTQGGIGLVDMSQCKDFFDRLENLWLQAYSAGASRGLAALTKGFDSLEVHKVGSYEVSIADTVEDIRRVDPAVFTLSANTEQILRESYAEGYKFLICKLTQWGEIHPLGYTYEASEAEVMFIPTKHGHGHQETTPMWDHKIYVQGADFLITDLGNSTPRIKASDAEWGHQELEFIRISTQVPELKDFINLRRRMNRMSMVGKYPNADLRMALS